MKKLISLLLAVIMVCSTGISAFAINATPTVTPAAVKAGEDVTINVTVDEAYSDLLLLETRLYFNANLFTVKSSSSENSDVTVRKDTLIYFCCYKSPDSHALCRLQGFISHR